MENKLNSPESKASQTKSVIQEFGEKISQALEMEKKKVREAAEDEVKQIIARAKEEAAKNIATARQEAETEAEKFFENVQLKAQEILEESRVKAAAEAKNESARIINETREKITQIIAGVIDNSIMQIKNELLHTSSELKSKLDGETTRLLAINKNTEQIIYETHANFQTEIDHLVNIIDATGNNLRSLNDTSVKEIAASIPQAIVEEIIEVEHIKEPEIKATIASATQPPEKTAESEPHRIPEYQEIAVSQIQAAARAGIESLEKIEERETRKAPEETVHVITAETITSKPARVVTAESIKAEPAHVTTAETVTAKPYEEIDKLMQTGIALLDLEKCEEALKVFARVTEMDPGNALAWRKLGTALGMLGRHVEALKALRRATHLTPKDITAWHNTEIILRKLGQKKEAKEAKDMEKQLMKQYPNQYKEITRKL